MNWRKSFLLSLAWGILPVVQVAYVRGPKTQKGHPAVQGDLFEYGRCEISFPQSPLREGNLPPQWTEIGF